MLLASLQREIQIEIEALFRVLLCLNIFLSLKLMIKIISLYRDMLGVLNLKSRNRITNSIYPTKRNNILSVQILEV